MLPSRQPVWFGLNSKMEGEKLKFNLSLFHIFLQKGKGIQVINFASHQEVCLCHGLGSDTTGAWF
jgi:hypothetical protein